MEGTRRRIAGNLVFLRKWRGITQEEIAELLGMTRMMYAFYETGRNIPSAQWLDEIAKFYGIPVAFILNRDLTNCTVSPWDTWESDDIQRQLAKYETLPFLHKCMVLERIRTLIDIESSLYKGID